MLKYNFLFILTGSIACYKVCELISRLVKEGHAVKAVCSTSALKFIGKATLEGLTGNPLFSDSFEEGKMMNHIELSRWADIVVAAPMTANSLNKLSAGIGDDLVSTLFLALEENKPVFIAPAMNTKMYQHPTVKTSLKTLAAWGYHILPTDHGLLACGEVGEGRLVNIEDFYSFIFETLKTNNTSLGLKVLITSGGTQEPIDSVRYITNMSSGETGSIIADQLYKQGCDVTYLHAKNAQKPNSEVNFIPFTSFEDLDVKLYQLLSQENYDVIIHSAAVSDFSVEQLQQGDTAVDKSTKNKLSSNENLTIKLKKNPKLINKLHNYSINKEILIFAFKLTSTLDADTRSAAVKKLFLNPHITRVIHNDLNEINSNQHNFGILSKSKLLATCKNKQDLAQIIFNQILSLKNTNTKPEETYHDTLS